MGLGTRPAACRVRLGVWPTPLQELDDGGGYYVKREDLCGFAFGGSKVRAVEPLLRDALTSGASSLVTGGRRDSNWAALAAIGAASVGLSCHCVFDPGPGLPLAMRLAARAGATIHVASARGATFCAGQPEAGVGGDQRRVVLVASGGLPAYFDALIPGGNTNAGGGR